MLLEAAVGRLGSHLATGDLFHCRRGHNSLWRLIDHAVVHQVDLDRLLSVFPFL